MACGITQQQRTCLSCVEAPEFCPNHRHKRLVIVFCFVLFSSESQDTSPGMNYEVNRHNYLFGFCSKLQSNFQKFLQPCTSVGGQCLTPFPSGCHLTMDCFICFFWSQRKQEVSCPSLTSSYPNMKTNKQNKY